MQYVSVQNLCFILQAHIFWPRRKNTAFVCSVRKLFLPRSLFAAAAGGAVAAAMFGARTRSRIHLTAVISFGGSSAGRADNLFVKFFNKFLKLLPAGRALVLQYRHNYFLSLSFLLLVRLVRFTVPPERINLPRTTPTPTVRTSVAAIIIQNHAIELLSALI